MAASRPPQCGEEIIAAHLHADIQHDGGSSVTSNPRVQQLWRSHPSIPLAVSGIEDKVVELFDTRGPAVNLAQRKQSRIDFIIRAKTDAFRSDTMSPFHPFGDAPNNQIAIVQDAGSHLFKAMHGSWNLLVPGSCIDPAGKPINQKDNPVWVKTSERMAVPACVFGFDPAVVGTLIWKDFKGLSVVFGFQYNGGKDMRWYDAAGGNIEGGTTFDTTVTTSKRANKLGGFLLSNEEISKEFKKGTPRIQLVIGKALGDAMQALGSVDGVNTRTKWPPVAGIAGGGSRRRKRRGTYRRQRGGAAYSNPAFPRDGSSYGHVGPRVPGSEEIKYIILNTGDRLEGVRAEEEGAAYVYGDPIERDNPIQTLFFVPGEVGVIDVDTLIDQTEKRLIKVFNDMVTSFDAVIADMSNSIKGGSFDPAYSIIEGNAYVTPETNLLAMEFMTQAVSSVSAVADAMKAHFNAERSRIIQTEKPVDKTAYLKSINDAYKVWNARAGTYAPSTTSIRKKKSLDIIRIHPIITLPKGQSIDTGGKAGKTDTKILEGSFAIYYGDVFQAIKAGNKNQVELRTPRWGAAVPAVVPKEAEVMAGGAGELFDSDETKLLYEEVTGPTTALFTAIMSIPKVGDTTAFFNAFSCHLNKHNLSRFGVEKVYELPTPDEIAAITPESRSDTFSTAAYFSYLEQEYLKTPKPVLSPLGVNIVSEFTGPLDLFAKYLNVTTNEATVVFINVDKKTCIDETLYESIEDDILFCMADSIPPEVEIEASRIPVSPPVAPLQPEVRPKDLPILELRNENKAKQERKAIDLREKERGKVLSAKRDRPPFSGLASPPNVPIRQPGGRRTHRRRLPKLL